MYICPSGVPPPVLLSLSLCFGSACGRCRQGVVNVSLSGLPFSVLASVVHQPAEVEKMEVDALMSFHRRLHPVL